MVDLPADLIEQLRSGRVIAFLGAGFTQPAGFPGWKQLLEQTCDTALKEGVLSKELSSLVQELLSGNTSAQQFDQAAQLIVDGLQAGKEEPGAGQTAMVSYLHRCLKPQLPLSPVMERRLALLRELPFAAVLTTNFNPLLRGVTPFDDAAPAAYRATLRPSRRPSTGRETTTRHQVASSFTDEAGSGKLEFVAVPYPIIQLHGAVDEPKSVVLTREGYRRLLYACPFYPTFLKTCFASHTILFLGFSFTDDYVNNYRSEVRGLLGDGAPLAYSIMADLTPAQVAFQLQHEGLHCLTFESEPGGGWGGFDALLEAVAAAVQTAEPEAGQPVRSPASPMALEPAVAARLTQLKSRRDGSEGSQTQAEDLCLEVTTDRLAEAKAATREVLANKQRGIEAELEEARAEAASLTASSHTVDLEAELAASKASAQRMAATIEKLQERLAKGEAEKKALLEEVQRHVNLLV